MPLVILSRLLASLLSFALLGFAVYLAWVWREGVAYYTGDGVLVRTREDWWLWVAGALFVWSFLGRFVLGAVLGRSDDERTLIKLERGSGELVDTPTGATVYIERIGDPAKPTLLFTHGWGLDSTIWQYAKRDLSPDFQLVFWDLPGLESQRPELTNKSTRRGLQQTSRP